MLLSCWACLSHDLYTEVQTKTTFTFSELLEQLHVHAQEIRAAALQHKQEYVDGDVPVAPCLVNLVMPLLKEKFPDRMQPRECRKRPSASRGVAEPAEPAQGDEDLSQALGHTEPVKEVHATGDQKVARRRGEKPGRKHTVAVGSATASAAGSATAERSESSPRKRWRRNSFVEEARETAWEVSPSSTEGPHGFLSKSSGSANLAKPAAAAAEPKARPTHRIRSKGQLRQSQAAQQTTKATSAKAAKKHMLAGKKNTQVAGNLQQHLLQI
jgi:hypothetical protein